MDNKLEIGQIQEELLGLLPQWNYRITKPFKQLLDEGISLEMYYCIRILRWLGGTATMTELGTYALMPKQQMTKMVNRLVEHQLVERLEDPADRRIIKIRLTDTAFQYIDHFLSEDAKCFRYLLEQMDGEDRIAFRNAIKTISDIFCRLPSPPGIMQE